MTSLGYRFFTSTFARLATISVTVPLYAKNRRVVFSHMDEVTPDVQDASYQYTNVSAIEEETEEEKLYWKEKRNCTFCTAFLDSPCSTQFKHWSRCVDKAKDGNIMISFVKHMSKSFLQLLYFN